MSENLLIGCRGFDNAPWVESYYPPEMPAGWRFCYYSNEIRALLVPIEEWARLDTERVEIWRRDCDPAFRFVFELPGDALRTGSIAAWRALLEPIWPRISAVVLKTGDDLAPDRIRDLPGFPCCLDSALPGQPDLSRVWFPDRESEPYNGGRFLVAVVGQRKPGELRSVLERIGRWMGAKRNAALFFADPKTSADDANEARVLAELMGL